MKRALDDGDRLVGAHGEFTLRGVSRPLTLRALRFACHEEAGREVCFTTDQRIEDGYIVLGADTAVVLDGQILGKPRDAEDAARMLRVLSGRTHQVFIGVSGRSAAATDSCLPNRPGSVREWHRAPNR